MSLILQIIVLVVVLGGGAWVFRFAGQQATGNAPRFRDMPYGMAFGYVSGGALVVWLVWTYWKATATAGQTPNPYFFFRVTIHWFIYFSITTYLFRLLGLSPRSSFQR